VCLRSFSARRQLSQGKVSAAGLFPPQFKAIRLLGLRRASPVFKGKLVGRRRHCTPELKRHCIGPCGPGKGEAFSCKATRCLEPCPQRCGLLNSSAGSLAVRAATLARCRAMAKAPAPKHLTATTRVMRTHFARPAFTVADAHDKVKETRAAARHRSAYQGRPGARREASQGDGG